MQKLIWFDEIMNFVCFVPKMKITCNFHSKRLFRSPFRKKSSIVSGNLEKKSPTFLTLCTKSALKKFTISRHKAPGRFTRLRSDCRVGLSPKVTRTYYEPRLAFRGRYGGHQRIASFESSLQSTFATVYKWGGEISQKQNHLLRFLLFLEN